MHSTVLTTVPPSAGDFIEDDNGEYGQDLGEEEDWNRSEVSTHFVFRERRVFLLSGL